MAKKKRTGNRFRNVAGVLITFIPRILAALTAFMNTSAAKDAGLVGTGDDTKSSKGRKKRTSKAGA